MEAHTLDIMASCGPTSYNRKKIQDLTIVDPFINKTILTGNDAISPPSELWIHLHFISN